MAKGKRSEDIKTSTFKIYSLDCTPLILVDELRNGN